jgi:hypothetical protein
VSIFGKSQARPLGIVSAPNDEKAAAKTIQYFCIEQALHFRVVVSKLGPVNAKERV